VLGVLETGKGVVKRKEDAVKRLLMACRESESRYLVRICEQNMRIGKSGLEVRVVPQ